MTTRPLLVTFRVADILERHEIPYCLVGSLATSAVGVPRATIDADLIAEFSPSKLISPESDRQMMMATPEDLVLSKLEWYELGNRVSERQWKDLLGIIKVQEALDWEYLKKWADNLGLLELLNEAQSDVSGQ